MQCRRWLRTIGKEPIVPFLMVGAALFGLQAWWSPQGSQANATIVVSDEQAAAIAVVAVLISGQVAATRRSELQIAVRVVGSWIAAAGLLALGLLARV
jgi:hypothetical protein